MCVAFAVRRRGAGVGESGAVQFGHRSGEKRGSGGLYYCINRVLIKCINQYT